MMKVVRKSTSWASAGSSVATLMFLWAMARQFLPLHIFSSYIHRCTRKLMQLFYPYIHITFMEYSRYGFQKSEAYSTIESYLSGASTDRAHHLKAELHSDRKSFILSMDDHEEVTDEYQGAKVWWYSRKTTSRTQTISLYSAPEDRRYYRLVFHRAQRKLIHESYLRYVMKQGKAIKLQRRQRKLYTNNPSSDKFDRRRLEWTHVAFKHPATFDTIAMDPDKKHEIIEDLLSFGKSKEYYSRIGKPWKRGYLLYGPPGTGKSSMIAAMANLMDYDVYDLELTAVKDNTVLKKLLIETTRKSIVVVEDIDCSLDLSGTRKKKKEEKSDKDHKAEIKATAQDKETSKVTLSGLLNSIDGLWSACGSERLMVFTTNYVDKLDPALVRRGRMDMHIELSYCTYQAFLVLANNYLGIEHHDLFGEIKQLLESNDITPADVAENLMPKSLDGIRDRQIEVCLRSLIRALKDCKAKAEAKVELLDQAAQAAEAENGDIESHQDANKEECSTCQ